MSVSRLAARWSLRLLGVALLAWVLATQVQWRDRIVRVDGTEIAGHIVRADSEGYAVQPEEGEAEIQVAADQVAKRAYGDKQVPDVSYGARTLLRRLASNLPIVVLVLAGLAGLVVLTAWRWNLLLRGLGLEMSFLRSMRLTFIGGFFNMAVPGATGGDVVKAWYAAKETRTGTRAVVSVFVDRFVGLFGLVVFAAGVLFFLDGGEAYRVPRLVVLGILAVAVVSGVIVVSRGIRRALGLSWLVRKLPFQGVIHEIQASARLYRGHAGTLLAALGISLFNHAGNATACWLLARALGIDGISLGTAMALVPLANLLSAVPLLPGGWGVGELAFAYFFGLVGVPPTEAVGLSVVFRLAVLGVNLPGGILWIFWRGHPSTATIAAEVQEATAHLAERTDPPSDES